MIIWIAVVAVLFAFAWRKGYLKAISRFTGDTRDELRKCSWPSNEELMSSTVVVLVATLVVGFFTVSVDFVMSRVLSWIL